MAPTYFSQKNHSTKNNTSEKSPSLPGTLDVINKKAIISYNKQQVPQSFNVTLKQRRDPLRRVRYRPVRCTALSTLISHPVKWEATFTWQKNPKMPKTCQNEHSTNANCIVGSA